MTGSTTSPVGSPAACRAGKPSSCWAAARPAACWHSSASVRPAADVPGCKRSGKACKEDKQCCSGICNSGTCAAACRSNGGTCTAGSQCCSGNCVTGMCSACPSGRVELSNGSCAIPCGTTSGNPECATCTGCGASNSGAGYCYNAGTGSEATCVTDSVCPRGEFCSQGATCQTIC